MMVQLQSPGRTARIDQGRAARERLSRKALRNFPAGKSRRNVLELLDQAEIHRVPKLLPVKYQRMTASPFAFFRGAVSVMASDLSLTPNTGCFVQLCGDAHVQNLGWYETPDGRIVFDLNDFDETIYGPWEWDVKRMATSLLLAGAESGHTVAFSRRAAERFADAYCNTMADLANQPILTAARYQVHRMAAAAPIGAALQQAKRATPLELASRYTEKNGRNQRVFLNSQNLWRIHGAERESVLTALPPYRDTLAPDRQHFFDFFTVRDVSFKIVGTGSVGLRDYVILMEGNGRKDPLFLQIKQEVDSAYQPYLSEAHEPAHGGQRVVQGQRRIQPISDLLLGWTSFGGFHYLVRQLNDHKGAIDLETLRGRGLSDLAAVAGHLLARGHARSGDAVAIASYIGSGDRVIESIVKYAEAAADATAQDFALFTKTHQ